MADPFTQAPLFPSPPHLRQQISDGETAQRHHESDAIAARYQGGLATRSPGHQMNPEYVASLPKSMIEKLRITPIEIEEILFHYAATSSVPKTVTESGHPRSKVIAVIYAPENQPQLSALREAMRISVLHKIEETQLILLDAIQDPTKLESATLSQLSDVLSEVSEVSNNLRSASQSASGGFAVDPASVFTGDELEYMAFLRRRLSASPNPINEPDPSHLSMNGHELIDIPFEPIPPLDTSIFGEPVEADTINLSPSVVENDDSVSIRD